MGKKKKKSPSHINNLFMLLPTPPHPHYPKKEGINEDEGEADIRGRKKESTGVGSRNGAER